MRLTYIQWIISSHAGEDVIPGLVLGQRHLNAVRVETDWRCGLDGESHFCCGCQWWDACVTDFHSELMQLTKKTKKKNIHTLVKYALTHLSTKPPLIKFFFFSDKVGYHL